MPTSVGTRDRCPICSRERSHYRGKVLFVDRRGVGREQPHSLNPVAPGKVGKTSWQRGKRHRVSLGRFTLRWGADR